MIDCFAPSSAVSLPVWCVTKDTFASAPIPEPARRFAEAAGFSGAAGKLLLLPNADGGLAGALFGIAPAPKSDAFATGALPGLLPEGVWRLEG